MSPTVAALPIVHELPRDFSITRAFEALKHLPGVLWLDSASSDRSPDSRHSAGQLGRYSFLTAAPIRTLSARIGDPNPWPELDAWCRELPTNGRDDLPPFQGGIAGVIGYEAATWLEDVPPAARDDLPTPAVCLGLYDWTIAADHLTAQAWIVCQGFGAAAETDRVRDASRRLEEVMAWLDAAPREASAGLPVARSGVESPLCVEGFPTPHPGILSNFAEGEFASRVAEIVQRIRCGDSFQVNLAQRLVTHARCAPTELYMRLRQANPAPFGGYYAGTGFSLLSSSPEGFLTVRDRVVQTRPIKGTAPRTGDPQLDDAYAKELSESEKDRAENIMIVDLMRNDLSRVCDDESVVVRQLCDVERYRYVQHLVSVIEGRLRSDASISDLLQACFPGGSVTGAPKIEAMRTIAALEPNPRGPYCGSLGYISCSGAADFNILIRCIVDVAGHWYFPVGGGITARSQPPSEEAETWTKAMGMLRAI